MNNKKNYYNLNYEKILGVPYYGIKDKNKAQKIMMIVKAFIGSIIRKYKSQKVLDSNIEFLFIKTQVRKDYNQLFNEIASQCSYKKHIQDIHLSYGLNAHFLAIFFSKGDLLYNLIKKYGWLNGIYLYVIAIRSLGALYILKPIKFKNLVVFSDVQHVENLIVQYCNMKNIKTVTMQHGLYIDYNDMPNINMLNYIDVSSKCLLAWGESTEELFKKYNEEIEISICGKPISLNQSCSEKDNNLIGVAFDQPMFRDFNKIMLRIAYKIALQKNMKVVVRLHPADDHKYYDYDINLTQLESDASKASYILAHTTTMIYEYLALGYKVFKFRSDVPANEIDEAIIFGSAEELANKLDMNFDFYKESLRHIGYVGDESKMKYKEFFDKLHDPALFIT